jgi:hypothetical protein
MESKIFNDKLIENLYIFINNEYDGSKNYNIYLIINRIIYNTREMIN